MSRLTPVVIVVGLVVLAVAGLVVVLDNPELYRDRITQAVKDETGFELKINGSIDWRIFPPVAIHIDDIEIILPGSDIPLASLKSASMDIKLIPLILGGGKVEVDSISIDGLVVNARVNKQGQSNWQPASDGGAPAEDNTSASEPDSGTSLDLNVQSFSMTNTQINYVDESDVVDYVVSITEFSAGPLKPGQLTDIRGDISFVDRINKIQVPINLSGRLGISKDMQQLALEQFHIDAHVKTKDRADVPVAITLNGTINTRQGTAEFKDSKLTVSDLEVLFSLSANDIFNVPWLQGHVSIPAFNPRNFAKNLNLELPEMANDVAMSRLSVATDIRGTRSQVMLSNLKLILDKSTLTGNGTVTLAPKTGLVFNLNIDAINVSDYMMAPRMAMAPTATATDTNGGGAATPAVDREVIPVALLSQIDLDNSLTLGKISYDTYQLTNVKMVLKNKSGRLNLSLRAKAYDGTLELKTTLRNINLGGTVAGTSALSATGINISKLTDFKAITGTIALDSNITFNGSMMRQLLDSLDGKSRFVVKNGTLDVSSIKQAGAMIGTLQGKPNDLALWPDRMPFTQMVGSHTINHGLANGQQFSFNTELLSIKGKGGLDYFANTINYDIRAEIKQDPKGQFKVSDRLTGIQWPLHCEGDLDASIASLCLPDRGSITVLLEEIAKQQLKRKGMNKLLEQVPDKYKKNIKRLFKGLFNERYQPDRAQ